MIENLKFFGWMALSLAMSTVIAAMLALPLIWSVLVTIGSYRRNPATLMINIPCIIALETMAIYWVVRVERLRQKIHTMVRRVYLGDGE